MAAKRPLVNSSGVLSEISTGDTVLASGFSTLSGTSSQFLKADGTTDATSYFPSAEPTRASIRPSLLLDFANSKTLDSRVTFSRASSATYYGKDGLLKTAASNVPRFDYDPVTGESLGLLIEEQRTNLLTYSENVTNAAWGKTNATVTANATIAPDGTLTACKLVEDTATAIHLVYQTATVTSATIYTRTLFVKSGERSIIEIQADTTFFSTPQRIKFNLSTQAITVLSGTQIGSIQSLTNGWNRLTVIYPATTGSGSNGFQIRITNDVEAVVYTGDGTSGLYIWGAQLEVGAFPTSYITTTSAQATRNADSAVMTGTNFSSWYRQDEGTVLAKANSNYSTSSATEQSLYSISDATTANYFNATRVSASNRFYGVTSSTAQFDLNSGAFTTGYSLFSNTYKVNSVNTSFNGATVLNDASVTIPTVSQINLGSTIGGNYLNGHIAKLAYYPKQLTNSELISLSTV